MNDKLKKEIETICKIYTITPNIDKCYMTNKMGYWETKEGYRNDVSTTIGFINAILDEYQESISALSYSLSVFTKENKKLSDENNQLQNKFNKIKDYIDNENYKDDDICCADLIPILQILNEGDDK